MKYTHFLSSLVFTLLFIFGGSSAAYADLKDRTEEVCKKVKVCAISEFERQGMSPQTIAKMEPLFENMCAPAIERYTREIVGKPGLEKKAEACLDTIMDVDCDVLMKSQGDFNTPACDEFKQAAEEYGIDAENVGQDAAKDLLIAPAPQK